MPAPASSRTAAKGRKNTAVTTSLPRGRGHHLVAPRPHASPPGNPRQFLDGRRPWGCGCPWGARRGRFWVPRPLPAPARTWVHAHCHAPQGLLGPQRLGRRPALLRRAGHPRTLLRARGALGVRVRDLPCRGTPQTPAPARAPRPPRIRPRHGRPGLQLASGRARTPLRGTPAASGGGGGAASGRRGADHGAEEVAAAAHRRAGPSRAGPAGATGAAARLAALCAGLRDADAAALGPPAARARLGRRAPREQPAAAAQPPAALRPGPPRDAQVLAVAARRAVLLAPHARAARLHGAELGARQGLGHPDLQRTHGERGPGDRAGHAPRLAAGAQARGGGLHGCHAGTARGRSVPCALPAAPPGHDSSGATEERGHQHRGAHAESREDARASLGLPCETGGEEEKGQGRRGVKRQSGQAVGEA